MMNAPIKTTDFTVCDLIEDLTDNWIEETDPENIEGDVCTGYFDQDDDLMTLKGLMVESGSLTTFYDREHAIKFLSYETVCRIEDVVSETARDAA